MVSSKVNFCHFEERSDKNLLKYSEEFSLRSKRPKNRFPTFYQSVNLWIRLQRCFPFCLTIAGHIR